MEFFPLLLQEFKQFVFILGWYCTSPKPTLQFIPKVLNEVEIRTLRWPWKTRYTIFVLPLGGLLCRMDRCIILLKRELFLSSRLSRNVFQALEYGLWCPIVPPIAPKDRHRTAPDHNRFVSGLNSWNKTLNVYSLLRFAPDPLSAMV